jgi:oleate hydratase
MAYLVGSGIGSLAAAAFMIRDCAVPGDHIVILESEPLVGGSLDAGGDSVAGYSMRGGRMFTSDNYECTWDLFKSIPSLCNPELSVFDETIAFNEKHRSHAQARLVDRERAILPVKSMGFSMWDRANLLKLYRTDEEILARTRISDWLPSEFFTTNFWLLWSTTFAFQPWHSAVEFKRYLHRFLLEFSRIDTLAGVKRTIYNQYDSLVLPLKTWLLQHGLQIRIGCEVTDIEHQYEFGKFVVTGIACLQDGKSERIAVCDGDLVFVQNGSMTDASSLGSMTAAPDELAKSRGGAWSLWESLAPGRPQFGDPAVFTQSIAQSWWGSFTVTLQDTTFFDAMQEFSGNEAGTGGLVTFKDSNWLLSVVLPHQPHFLNQAQGTQVFWGYALFGDRIGNYVAKPMSLCTGAEILEELCGHLQFDREVFKTANCIPCRMPYITSQFMPRLASDRPLPVPAESKNMAFVSQFVEIADDTVFTVEYSVRAAQMAVYQLFQVDRAVPAVTPHDQSPDTQFEALIKAFTWQRATVPYGLLPPPPRV